MSHSSSITSPHGHEQQRITLWALSILLMLTFALVYGNNLLRIVVLWFTKPHSYAQGALIFCVSIYMVFHHAAELRRLQIQPWITAGILLTTVAGLLFLAGNLTETRVLEQVAVIGTLLGLVLLIAGPQYFKILCIPIGYLIFLFPLFGTLLGGRILILQKYSAAIGAGLLKISGFSVFRQGHLIQLPHISLDVVEACSGLNHIVSLVAIAVPLAFFARLPRWWKLALLFVAVAIGIFANGLRIALIGIWTHFFRQADVHGPADVLLISFVFIFGLAALLSLTGLLTRFSRRAPKPHRAVTAGKVSAMPRRSVEKAVLAGLVVLLGVKAGSWYFNTPSVPYPNGVLPTAVGQWQGQPWPGDAPIFDQIAADRKLNYVYHHASGLQATVFFAYFAKQTANREVFSTPTNLLTAGARIETITLKDGSLQPVMAFEIEDGAKSRSALAVYRVRGKFYADRLYTKWALLKTTLLQRQNNAALIVFIAPASQYANSPPPHEKLAQEMLTVMRAGVAAS